MASGDLSKKSHPRLWLSAEAEKALADKIATDPLANRMNKAAMDEAWRILNQRNCRYEIPDGKRLLRESRLAFHNILHCAWAWRMGGGEKYRLRTIAELEAACALKDWNPSHFLDTAEMAAAVATGYDWLYPTLTPEQRAMCERAIIDKALKPARKVYDGKGWWTAGRNNWAQVCGSGVALAAAAIAGKDEGLSEDLFESGLKLVESCGKFYQPDGMYPEGPGYWQYGTNYHVILLAACAPLERRTDDAPVLEKAGNSIMHLTGPTGLSFNFADGNASVQTPTAAQCWLASRYQNAAQASHVRNALKRALDANHGKASGDRFFPLAILWLPDAPARDGSLPTAAVFRGEQAVASFRSGWDAQASWIAIKGGTPASSHGQMDVGSFVYDAHGTRWIHDMGSDDYNLPAYFGNKRWNYYRLQNVSHNTLEIEGKLQNPDSDPCPLTTSDISGDTLSATFDLTGAYAGSAERVLRSACFQKQTGVVRIMDEITSPSGDVLWRVVTDADCEATGDKVILRKKDSHVTLRRISAIGTWSINGLTPPTPGENQNEEYRSVVLTVPGADRVSVIVEIQP
jgi:hypothetical protein